MFRPFRALVKGKKYTDKIVFRSASLIAHMTCSCIAKLHWCEGGGPVGHSKPWTLIHGDQPTTGARWSEPMPWSVWSEQNARRTTTWMREDQIRSDRHHCQGNLPGKRPHGEEGNNRIQSGKDNHPSRWYFRIRSINGAFAGGKSRVTNSSGVTQRRPSLAKGFTSDGLNRRQR